MGIEKILRKVASAHGITAEEVKEEIEKAIEEAWRNPPDDGGVTIACQRKVAYKGEIPAPEEVIRYILGELLKNS